MKRSFDFFFFLQYQLLIIFYFYAIYKDAHDTERALNIWPHCVIAWISLFHYYFSRDRMNSLTHYIDQAMQALEWWKQRNVSTEKKNEHFFKMSKFNCV